MALVAGPLSPLVAVAEELPVPVPAKVPETRDVADNLKILCPLKTPTSTLSFASANKPTGPFRYIDVIGKPFEEAAEFGSPANVVTMPLESTFRTFSAPASAMNSPARLEDDE